MLEILLSSGSFDEQFQNINRFLLYTTLSEHLEQPGFKKYGDDMKMKCFDNMANIYARSFKSKGKVSYDQKYFLDYIMTSIVHTPSPEAFFNFISCYPE